MSGGKHGDGHHERSGRVVSGQARPGRTRSGRAPAAGCCRMPARPDIQLRHTAVVPALAIVKADGELVGGRAERVVRRCAVGASHPRARSGVRRAASGSPELSDPLRSDVRLFGFGELDVVASDPCIARPERVVGRDVGKMKPPGGDLPLILRFQSCTGGRNPRLITIRIGGFCNGRSAHVDRGPGSLRFSI
jgi:hypothetical protein